MVSPEPTETRALPGSPQQASNDFGEMTFLEHLEELRNRSIKSLIIWVFVFAGCFAYVQPLFELISFPLSRLSQTEYVFAATDFAEPFLANIRVAFWISVILSSPLFFYHIWAFVAPGLEKEEKRFAIPFLTFMTVFFLIGCWFSFSVVFPIALEYFMEWNTDSLHAYTRSSYVKLLFLFIIGMGASFEMPLLIFFLAKIGLVTPRFLIDKFRYAIILIFTVAAIITPTPDIYLQSALALPMVALYFVGVGAAWFVQKQPKEDEQQPETPPDS
jgi:sec-independent protein translocase protein TatC